MSRTKKLNKVREVQASLDSRFIGGLKNLRLPSWILQPTEPESLAFNEQAHPLLRAIPWVLSVESNPYGIDITTVDNVSISIERQASCGIGAMWTDEPYCVVEGQPDTASDVQSRFAELREVLTTLDQQHKQQLFKDGILMATNPWTSTYAVKDRAWQNAEAIPGEYAINANGQLVRPGSSVVMYLPLKAIRALRGT